MGVEFILLQPTSILYALIFLFMILMFPILMKAVAREPAAHMFVWGPFTYAH